MTLVEMMRRLAEDARMTHIRVTERMKDFGVYMTRQSIANYMTGRRTPDNRTMSAFLNAVDAPPARRREVWLMLGVDEASLTKPSAPYTVTVESTVPLAYETVAALCLSVPNGYSVGQDVQVVVSGFGDGLVADRWLFAGGRGNLRITEAP